VTDGYANAAPWRAGLGKGHDDLEGHERVRASYRGNYGRLAQIKAAYDPGNLFRVNQKHPAEGIALCPGQHSRKDPKPT